MKMEVEPHRNSSEHRIAIQNFDGTSQIVEADELRICVPTKECIKFWALTIACFVSMGIGMFFMIWGGTSSAYFFIGESLLVMGIGVLIPGPDIASMKTRSRRSLRILSEPRSPGHGDSSSRLPARDPDTLPV
jgi:hypothetical protein